MFSKKSHESDSRLPQGLHPISDHKGQEFEFEICLKDLSVLLEAYAPSWYTRVHSERVESALRRQEPLAPIFEELYNLLKEYSPSWYPEKQQKDAESVIQRLKSLEVTATEDFARRAAHS